MSGYLAGRVWQSNLPSTLKPLAACLADFANHDGGGVFPSVEYLVWLLGAGESTVRQGMAALRKLGVITAVENATGGRGKIPVYDFNMFALPAREPWKGMKKGPGTRPLQKGPDSGVERVQIPELKGPENRSRNKEEPLAVNREVNRQVTRLPDWLPLEAWNGFIEHRKVMGHPLTARAQKLTLNELDTLRRTGQDPGKVLDQSVQRGWRGVFAIKDEYKGNDNGRAVHSSSAAERRAESNVESLRDALRSHIGNRVVSDGGERKNSTRSTPEPGVTEGIRRPIS